MILLILVCMSRATAVDFSKFSSRFVHDPTRPSEEERDHFVDVCR